MTARKTPISAAPTVLPAAAHNEHPEPPPEVPTAWRVVGKEFTFTQFLMFFVPLLGGVVLWTNNQTTATNLMQYQVAEIRAHTLLTDKTQADQGAMLTTLIAGQTQYRQEQIQNRQEQTDQKVLLQDIHNQVEALRSHVR